MPLFHPKSPLRANEFDFVEGHLIALSIHRILMRYGSQSFLIKARSAQDDRGY